MDSSAPQSAPPSPPPATRRRSFLASDIVRLSILTVAIFALMAALAPARFLSAGNLGSMAFQFPEFAILALAMMLAMLTGGIDLAIIGIANLSAIVAALIMAALAGPQGTGAVAGFAILVAVLASLGVGALAGLFNGIAIGVFGLPPILATLGSGLVFTGLGVAITGGSAVLGLPPAFAVVGNGSLVGIPVPLIIVSVLGILVALMLERTALGLKMRMFGTNPLAARFAGIDDVGLTVRTYLMSGMLAAAAGLVIMSRANSAKADYGSSYLLLSILICVLGGINPFGGFGRVSGLALAVLSLQFLSSGLNMLQVSNFAKELIWGSLLLGVMVASSVQFRRKAG
ncbi:ABC transporter permease [Aureimonas endophytica]|uniref:ABC transporter permease n=1 Tax=Aureimonas endophytica TaxID=2027858 RepID=A0A917E5D2_9HYPH|nr:ABC transporter permease [Aureimonas endophytica]GGE06071.1 ABC transporter permease [Aureimonas endophytica]